MTKRLFARIGLGLVFTTMLASAVTVPANGAPAAERTAVVKGQVFGDANSNKRPDRGEGLRGVQLELEKVNTRKTYKVTTAAKGRFRIVLPTGRYYLSGKAQHWKLSYKTFRLRPDGKVLSLRAVKPLGKVLKAEMRFTENKYAPGDRVHVVATLTNTGSKVLRGIGAECNHIGDDDELFNRGHGWGKLAFDGPGVALQPHKTRTFDIHDKVPAAAQRFGQVVVNCDFGYPGVDEGRRADGSDSARVPGQFGAIAGLVGHYRPGHPNHLIGLAHVRVVLVNPEACPVYTRRTKTGPHGHFRIGHAPAGQRYELFLYPTSGWKVRYGNPSPTQIFGNTTGRFSSEVVRGHKHVPAPPTKCS